MAMPLRFPSIFTICGATGRGKSSLVRYLFRNYATEFRYGMCFCPTAFDGDYDWLSNGVYDVLDETRIVQFIAHKKHEEELVRHGAMRQCKPCFLVFDDCIGEGFCKAFSRRDSIYSQLIVKHRHWNLSLFFSTQYTSYLPAFARENTMYAFIFRQFSQDAWQAVYRAFGGHFPSKKAFCEYCERNCPIETYRSIMVCTRAKTPEEMFQVIEIPHPASIPPFRVTFGKKR
jgi:hypothetical protein